MTNPYKKIIKMLHDSGLSYREYEHSPVITSKEAAAIREIDPRHGAKSLLFKTAEEFILVVLPGNRKVDFKKLKAELKTDNIRFATSEEIEEIMGCQVGACYPFGNVANLKTYADESLSKAKFIACNIGLRTHSVEIAWNDYLEITNPKVVDFSKIE